MRHCRPLPAVVLCSLAWALSSEVARALPRAACADPARAAARLEPRSSADARAPEAAHELELVGRVLAPDGQPAVGALVFTQLGGRALTKADGSFELGLEAPSGATSLLVSAASSALAGNLVAHTSVGIGPSSRRIELGSLALALASGCSPDWLPTFGGLPGVNGLVAAFAVYDDGAGPALYAGGAFTAVAGVAANNIARWDGQQWSALGNGVSGPVHALEVYNDGTGAALYAGGQFTGAGSLPANNIARWKAGSWSALGLGVQVANPIFDPPVDVRALRTFDYGSGRALYVGGSYNKAGGISMPFARWNGSSWSAVPGGGAEAYAMVVWNDGSGGGNALYVAGSFVGGIAKFNGSSWSVLGSVATVPSALAVYDDGLGAGPALYMGGSFASVSGVPAAGVARWNGANWSALGAGITGGVVRSLASFDDGSGAKLCAGGSFTSAGGSSASQIAAWDGLGWSALGAGISGPSLGVSALASFQASGGAAPALFAGGTFTSAGGLAVLHLARWQAGAWGAFGDGLGGTGNPCTACAQINALAVWDDGLGDGPALYLGGEFGSVGGLAAANIARWDGAHWSALGSGTSAPVQSLAVFDAGSGPALYAGGSFQQAGGIPALGIARWKDGSWSALGSGLAGTVYALAVYDDGLGAGPALYAGGSMAKAGALDVNKIARWNGATWSALAGGLSSTLQHEVRALLVYDFNGGAPQLVAGGVFPSDVKRWNGSAWSNLASGLPAQVRSLAVHDDGGGPALYAGGDFSGSGSVTWNGIARWSGSAWLGVGAGLDVGVTCLASFDDGHGPALYAGGYFTPASGAAGQRIARWDGASWSPLGSGLALGKPNALAVFDAAGASAPILCIGGEFASSPAGDSYLAAWGCPSAFADVPGCLAHRASLSPLDNLLAVGQPFTLQLASSAQPNGLALCYLGADGTDAAGCGLALPGLGEVLLALAPAPALLAQSTTSGGSALFALAVPPQAGLAGLELVFQAANVAIALPGAPAELSNALRGTITP